ncbi:DUF4172 domain-containing protein [Halomonas sp. BDJS001]|nr:DUF4172 domain-containing protein [Halomonas sp. BDJS001]UZH12331.1 DUF4172 domain-containing protein [Halomonas sp. BDJS001]
MEGERPNVGSVRSSFAR